MPSALSPVQVQVVLRSRTSAGDHHRQQHPTRVPTWPVIPSTGLQGIMDSTHRRLGCRADRTRTAIRVSTEPAAGWDMGRYARPLTARASDWAQPMGEPCRRGAFWRLFMMTAARVYDDDSN